MKKDPVKLVKDVAAMTGGMSEMTQDRVNDLAPELEETEVKLTTKQIAARDGVRYIEPKRKLPGFGADNMKSEWKPKHARDWEYTLGMFQGEARNGSHSQDPKTFWHCKWPGDPDCLWEIPVEVPVYLPRMIAKYLAGEKEEDTGMESMKYHKFDYRERPINYQRPDDFTHDFAPVSTHHRGRFIPLGQFA